MTETLPPCLVCRTPLVRWHETWLCLQCDTAPNRAGWATDWARSVEDEQ